MHNEPEVKIVLLGDGGVGKTSFAKRFVLQSSGDVFYKPTAGGEVRLYHFLTTRGNILVSCWDYAGGEIRCLPRDNFCRGAQGAMFFFDLTSQRSLENLSYYQEGLEQVCGKIPSVVCGNKLDQITNQTEDFQSDHIPIAAKANHNWFLPFQTLLRLITHDDHLEILLDPEQSLLPPEVSLAHLHTKPTRSSLDEKVNDTNI